MVLFIQQAGGIKEGSYSKWNLLFVKTLNPAINPYADLYLIPDEANNKVYIADPTFFLTLAVLDINTQTINETIAGITQTKVANLGGGFPTYFTGGKSIASIANKYACFINASFTAGVPGTLIVMSGGQVIFSTQLPSSFDPSILNNGADIPAVISPTGKYIVVAGANGNRTTPYLTVAVYQGS